MHHKVLSLFTEYLSIQLIALTAQKPAFIVALEFLLDISFGCLVGQITIERLKERLQSHCGTSPSAMFLQLKDHSNQIVAYLDDLQKKLGFYSPDDGCVPLSFTQSPPHHIMVTTIHN